MIAPAPPSPPARPRRPAPAPAAPLFVALALSAACRPDQRTRPDANASPAAVASPPVATSLASAASARAAGPSPPPPASTTAAAPGPEPGQSPRPPTRVYAKTRYVWVRYEPRYTAGWTGILWLGGSAKLRDPAPVRVGADCAWYAVEPRGYVCVDEVGATLDPDDPVLRELRPFAPRLDRAAPYAYGESRDTPRYRSPPTPDEQRRHEGSLEPLAAPTEAFGRPLAAPTEAFGRPLAAPRPAAPEDVAGPAPDGPPAVAPTPAADAPPDGRVPAGEGPPVFSSLPPTLQHDRDRMPPFSTVSWSYEAVAGGRTWLLAGDFTWMPKDRVVAYPPDAFRGVELGGAARLPLAFFRGKDRPKYRRRPAGGFEPTGEAWPRLSWVGLTGAFEAAAGGAFLETKENGLFVLAADAVVPEPRATPPLGPAAGEGAAKGRAPAGRGTWIDVSIEGGWLLAYEGARPVYATLISPGRGGAPRRGRPTLETASTPTGRFSINGKFATATMEAPNDFVHSDVPWSLTFVGPYAIHAAYWHDRWGEKMSAGCINVSAEDGRWLFHWAEPSLPEGWHGVRWEPSAGPATLLFVRP